LRDISFELRRGEVLGIGGVAGNGQDELLMALSGEHQQRPGILFYDGRDIGKLGADARRTMGVLSAPEERLGHAAAPNMSLTENAALTAARRQGLLSNGFVSWPAAKDFAEKVIAAFDVRTPGPGAAARALSGGNLQKFVIGREVMQNPEVLIVNQPTWGVDAAAAAFIRQSMLDLAAKGAGVIVISQDLDEVMEISDRFAALNEGRLSAPVPTRDLTMERIGLMLGGAHDMEVAR
jgi:simple sugar transport system ATP-binding protein